MVWKLPFSFSSRKVRCHLCIAHSETADSYKMHLPTVYYMHCKYKTYSSLWKRTLTMDRILTSLSLMTQSLLDCEATPVQFAFSHTLQSSVSLLPHRTVTQHSAALTLTVYSNVQVPRSQVS